jgi:hypothetical protein
LTSPVLRTGNLDFYRKRAAEASADAAAATLVHVRERCLRSEAAWAALADRAERSEQLRSADEERRGVHKQADTKESADGNG